MELRDRVVIITGGGRGIGRTMAHTCAAAGARVVVAARSTAELEQVAKEGDGEILPVSCDVTDPDQVDRLFTTTRERFGPAYGLICAAGIYGPIGPLESCDIDHWRQAVDINLHGTMLCVRRAIPEMKAMGGGRIVFMSGGGQGPLPNFSAYVTSKGAVWRLTETLGAELAPAGIYVNAIAPGAVNTRFLEDLLAAGPEKVGEELYRKSLAQKEEGGASPQKAADLALYLLGEDSKGLAGKTLSALWDPYTSFTDLEEMSGSDIYAFRRVIDDQGGTRF